MAILSHDNIHAYTLYLLDHAVIDANGLIILEIVGSYVIDVNDLV
jgi:hypothetical protein